MRATSYLTPWLLLAPLLLLAPPLLLAGCAGGRGPLPGRATSGICGLEAVSVIALGME